MGSRAETDSQYVKVLGISWDAGKDHFTYSLHIHHVAELPSAIHCTKHSVLSLIARFFLVLFCHFPCVPDSCFKMCGG